IPLAPNPSKLSSSRGPLATPQELGTGETAENVVSPTTFTGMELATSPAIFTSAVSTGPHRKVVSANWTHSPRGFPPTVVLPSASVNSPPDEEDKSLNPTDPVSTKT